MVLHNLCLLALLVVFTTATLDCTHENPCYGEPPGCNPNSNCNSVLQLDTDGTLQLHLRNVKDPNGYVVVAIDRHPEDILDYFICVPHQGKRLRAEANLGNAVSVTEHGPVGLVQKVGENLFRCVFTNVADFTNQLQVDQPIVLFKGTFGKSFAISNGVQQSSLGLLVDSNEFIDDEVIPVVHPVSDRQRTMEDVFGSDDMEFVFDSIKNLPRTTDTKEDMEMENLARLSHHHSKKANSRHQKKIDEDEDEDIEKEEKVSSKRYKTRGHRNENSEDSEDKDKYNRPRRRQSPKSRSRPTRREEDDDDDIDEDDEDEKEFRPKRWNTKRPRRIHKEVDSEESDFDDKPTNRISTNKSNRNTEEKDYEDEPKRKTSKKNKKYAEDDDYDKESEDDIYDDLLNSGNGKPKNVIMTSGVAVLVAGFVLII